MNVNASDRATNKRVKYLRQRVSITGMGNATLDNVAASRIHAIFKCAIGNELKEDSVLSDFKGYRTLDTSN